ncbi:anti-sigma factor domain-containing protein [Streptomyces sp. TR06-5]|uniref:anti-sigma factor n=1 Tax=unclassified Streptomyces TaxID=2593676 RepID=UPI0039A250EC
MTTADLHTLTGAYSVHALPEGEREEFERHLDECSACAQEVKELTATASKLGLAASVTPPPSLRETVFSEIANTRQEPPQVSRVRRSGRTGGVARSLPRLALAASLAAAAALGGVAVWQYQIAQDAQQRADRAEQRGATMAQLLAAPDAKVTVGELPGGGHASVVVSRGEDRAAFVASGLPEAPRGKVYQLWFSENGAMRPAGLLDGASQGSSVLMDGPVGDASAMGITLEPAGGSPQPTSKPLALMNLPA